MWKKLPACSSTTAARRGRCCDSRGSIVVSAAWLSWGVIFSKKAIVEAQLVASANALAREQSKMWDVTPAHNKHGQVRVARVVDEAGKIAVLLRINTRGESG